MFYSSFRRPKQIRARHICLVLSLIYIILEALVIATCVNPQTKNYYLSRTKFVAKAVSSDDSITLLDLRLGYFASCIQATTQSSKSSWVCGADATDVLAGLSNFSASDKADASLYYLVQDTTDIIRRRCLTPYILLISVLLAFLITVIMAVLSARHHTAYKFLFILSYFSLALSVIASVWQETNIKTVNMLLGSVLDDYYKLHSDYGQYTRAAVWTGTGIQIFITGCCLLILLKSSRHGWFEPDFDHDMEELR